MPTARGSFTVRSTPLAATEADAEVGVGRMRFDKVFEGDLVGTSVVVMAGLIDRERGSGGYVAMEKVDGELAGRKGTFHLQHSSTMERGRASQSVVVIPDSATGDLTGLSGTLVIDVRDKQHFYSFEYTLPASGG